MISRRVRQKISRIVPFALIWFISSVVYTLLERGVIGELTHYPATGNPYDFSNNFITTTVTATLVGILIGTAEVLYMKELFADRSFAQKILVKVLIYFTLIVLFLCILSVITNAVHLNVTLNHPRVWMNAWIFFSSFSFWGVGIFVAYGIIISLFVDEVNGNFGPGTLNNFFSGKYHKPIQEERIFMFLDMKSSTTIAENMGHVKYFEMLKEYFADLTEPIVDYGAKIYQYVGDEIVLSWNLAEGIQSNNCIECFFKMKGHLKNKESKYLQNFGVLPDFKAGLHAGSVTTGVIGVIKKEIIFTGDVLNTTSRIQSLCNTYKADLLISEQVISLLHPSQEIKLLGEAALKGRDEKVTLYTYLRLF